MAIQYIGNIISGLAGDTKPTLTANEKGVLFVETDTDKLYQWDGDSWNAATASDATTSTKGVASFHSDNFAVSSGAVTIKDGGVILGTETTGNYVATVAGTSNEITVSGSTGAVTIGMPDDVTIGGDLVITGDLTVSGDTVTANTATLTVEDPLIYLANGQSSSPAYDSGFVVERGNTTNVAFIWDESADEFVVANVPANEVGTTAGNVTIDSYANLKAGNIAGTITTATQNSITTMTGLVTTSALNSGSITSGFGNIDIGSSNLTATGTVTTGLSANSIVVTNGSSQLTVSATTSGELAAIDGSTSATSTTLADADRVVVNDAGTMVQVALTDFETYFESALDTLSNVTTVGALNAGSITSGFTSIDVGAGAITTTGLISGGSLDIDNVLINGTTIGHTDDTDLMTLADGVLTVAGELDATTLDISGNADIDGTTNLDAVDIDGAVQIDNTVTVGVDDTGYDVKFFGATANNYWLWDESANRVRQYGGATTYTDFLASTEIRFSHAASNVNNAVIGQISGANLYFGSGRLAEIEFRNSATYEHGGADIALRTVESDSSTTMTDRIHIANTGTVTIGGILDLTNTTDSSDDSGDTGALRVEGGASIAKKLYVGTDLDVDGTANLDAVDIDGGLTVDGATVFNETSADVDFRIESNANTHMFFVDAGNNKIGINQSSPVVPLHVNTGGSGTNSAQHGIIIDATTTGTAAGGFGSGMLFRAESAGGSQAYQGKFEYIYNDATDSAEDTRFDLYNTVNGSLTKQFSITETGAGIGVDNPDQKLEVAGAIHMSGEVSTPSQPSGGDGGIMYVKTDGKLYWRSNEISETDLTSGGAVSAVASGADNRIATFSSTDALNGEANLTFSGSALQLTGTLTVGASGSGHDVTFYGDTANDKLQWDASINSLLALHGAKIGVGNEPFTPASQLELLGHTPADPTLTLTMLQNAITGGNVIGNIDFRGTDTDGSGGTGQSAARVGARIKAVAGDTWGTDEHDNPTRLQFMTQTDGDADGMGTRMTIDHTGTVTVEGVFDVTDGTDSSDDSGDTGAIRTEGGASIAKKLYVGSTLQVNGKITSETIYYIQVALSAPATAVAAAAPSAQVAIPADMNGMNLVEARAVCATAPAGAATTINIRRHEDDQNMCTTINIATSARTSTGGSPDASYDDVATDDMLHIDVASVGSTPAAGVIVTLGFAKSV